MSTQLHWSEIGWTYPYELAAVYVYSQLNTRLVSSGLKVIVASSYRQLVNPAAAMVL